MHEERKGYNLFRRGVFAVWVLLVVVTYLTSTSYHVNWTHFAFFLILAAVCESMPVHVAKGREITLVPLVIWAAMLIHPPFHIMMIAFLAASLVNGAKWVFARLHHSYTKDSVEDRLSSNWFLFKLTHVLASNWADRHEYPLRHVLSLLQFHASTAAIYAGAAGLAYVASDGRPLMVDGDAAISLAHNVVPLLAAVAVYFALDHSVFAAMCVFWENRPEYTHFWRSWFLRWRIHLLQAVPMAMRYLLIAVLALTLAWLFASHGPIFVAALILPMYFIGHSMKQTVQMEQAYRETITGLGTYVQLYHPYTRGHLKRVAELSERLARELNLSAESVRWMPDAGMLHDIGKVGVSEEILDKPGRPTDEEWAKIQEHPVKGAEIISQMEFLDKIVDWVKYHHKWFDGSGYPRDDRNGDVPIEAHIIAIADAFDAMTDDRELASDWSCDSCGFSPDDDERPLVCPKCGAEKSRRYRQPLTLDEAMEELRRGAGTQFRPEAVKAFLRMIQREGVHIVGGD